jgi:cellulose synthase/poly-beta-1,6-N-acetylglucosamine synthase-like glycosyltransferase
MTEDMDLSYRAQLAGWRILFLPDVAAPAELPPQMEAFKQQQARWARGSMQCLRKMSGPVLRSPRLSPCQKLMSLLHMSAYLSQPLMIGLLLASLPVIWRGEHMPAFFSVLAVAGLGPPLLFAVSQSALYPDWKRRLLFMPMLAVVGVGIAPGITRAVLQGLTRWGGSFRRTPKFRIEGRQGAWAGSVYKLMPDWLVFGEILLAAYALLACTAAWIRGSYGAVPFMIVYALGFGLAACLGLFQGARR